ncbi:hypothetical protein ABW19_dt0201022 [Dactylella cylindrospora]|nr:hypothetical protein ABW19_dt0201022 [Dactylella cylindrospora]
MLMPARRNLGHVFAIIFFGGLFVLLLIEPKDIIPGTVSITIHKPWASDHTPKPFNETKLALLIENRVQSHLTPLLLHFMAVVPPDWPFMFMGSEASIAHINKSAPIRAYEKQGKLTYKLIPENMTINGQEEISKTMTNTWFYQQFLPAEWLFLFQTDSIICANSGASLNDWVEKEYTWVGASWGQDTKYGGRLI